MSSRSRAVVRIGHADRAEPLGRGIAALAEVAHDRDLARGNVAVAITTQDGTRIERVHVRVTTACEWL